MALEALSQSGRNELDPESKHDLQEDDTSNRSPKRIKRVHSRPSLGNSKKDNNKGKERGVGNEKEDSLSVADIDPIAFDEGLDGGLDASLLTPDNNDEAIAEYTKSGKYRKSMYVEAFNLALDTVLQDELHLFSDAEQEVFAKYRSLEYEPQFLYVNRDQLPQYHIC